MSQRSRACHWLVELGMNKHNNKPLHIRGISDGKNLRLVSEDGAYTG